MKEVALALMLWISQNSAYNTTDMPLPQIIEMSPEELTDKAYSDTQQMKPESGVDDNIWGLYNFEDGPNGAIYILRAEYTHESVLRVNPAFKDDGPHGVIYILGAAYNLDDAPRPKPTIKDPIFQERLLHELIHHVQHLAGASDAFPCHNVGEFEAYQMGGEFLKQRNAPDPLPNRHFLSRMYSHC